MAKRKDVRVAYGKDEAVDFGPCCSATAVMLYGCCVCHALVCVSCHGREFCSSEFCMKRELVEEDAKGGGTGGKGSRDG